MARVLQGVRILDLGTMVTGPLAAVLLADLGADVVKIEKPGGGDPFRQFRGGNYSGHFAAFNRSKRSVCLDLQTAAGCSALRDLACDADALIENFRPGVMERLGLGYEVLRELNEGLVYCSITGFGPDGPYRDRPAYDGVGQSLAGVMHLFLDPERPQVAGPTLADNITGYYAGIGVLGALFERERTGKGRRVEVNLLECTMSLTPDNFAAYTQHGLDVGPLTRVSMSQTFAARCADGALIALHLSSPEKFWQGLLTALDAPHLGQDARFSARIGRIQNYVELRSELAKLFATRPRAEWIARLEANDVPFAPVLSIPEVFEDPQVEHLDTFFTVEHPTAGKVTGLRSPIRYDREKNEVARPPPTLGEHTDELLSQARSKANPAAQPAP